MSYEDRAPIYRGMRLYGYCNGYFGRDSYYTKIIRDFGNDWVLVVDEEGRQPDIAHFDSWEQMLEKLAQWNVKPKDGEY